MSSRRRIKRKLSSRELTERLRVKCPKCGKVAASSEEDAWELARKQFARNGGEMPRRVYPCFDGGPYHWTRVESYSPLGPYITRPDSELYTAEYWGVQD